MQRVVWALLGGVAILDPAAACGAAERDAAMGRVHAFVGANVTVRSGGRRMRVRVVSRVFPLCASRDRPSAVLGDSERSLHAVLRRAYGARYEVTYLYLHRSASAECAARRRVRDLESAHFSEAIRMPYVWQVRGACR